MSRLQVQHFWNLALDGRHIDIACQLQHSTATAEGPTVT